MGYKWITVGGMIAGIVVPATFSDEAGLYANLSDVTNFAQTNVAEEISANYEVQDDINFSFGNDDDFSFKHNTTSTNYEIVNAANSALWWLTPAGGVGTISTANPYIAMYDSNAAGIDRADEFTGMLTWGFSTTTEDAEISDWALTSIGCATAGTEYTNLFWDGSESHLYMGVFADYTGANPSVAPLDVANFESLVWDCDYAEDTIGVSSSVSGTTTIDFTTLNLLTTGSLAGKPVITSAGSERVLTAAECSGGIVLVTAAVEVRVPDICDSATGAMVMIVQADVSEVLEIAVTDTNDHFFLDGVDLGANQEIDSPGAAKEDDYICLFCREANEWHSYGRSGTWVDGGAAD